MGQREQERQRGKRRENRHEKSDALHSGGGEWDCIRIPDGLEVFKPEKDKTYHIDVIPYIVGKHNRAAEPGDEYFELSYPVYRDLGIDEKKYIAIGELKGVRDPVAEHFAHLKKNGTEWDDMKMFKPTERTLFLFFVHEQADKGLQLFEGAFGTFFEQLKKEIKDLDEPWADNFDDPDHGATVKARFEAKSIGQKNPWVKVDKMNLEERKDGFTADGNKKLRAEVLAKAAEIRLDDILKIPDYDTLKKALDGEPIAGDGDEERPAKKRDEGGTGKKKPEPDEDEDDDDDDEDTPPAKKKEEEPSKKGKPEPEDDDDDGEEEKPAAGKKNLAEKLGVKKGMEVTHEKHGKCTVLKIAEDGDTCTLMDADDDVHKNIDVSDVEPVVAKGEARAAAGATEKNAAADTKKGKEGASSAGKKDASTQPASPSKKGAGKNDDWDDDWDDDEKGKKKK